MVSVAEDELTKDTDAAGPDLWRSGTAAQANKAGAPDRYWLGMFRQSCKRQHQPVTGWLSAFCASTRIRIGCCAGKILIRMVALDSPRKI